MIYGVGLDIVQIGRIEKILSKYGDKFILRFFSKEDLEKYHKIKCKKKSASFIAKRYAAKEAFVKSVGLGFTKGIKIKDINIKNNQKGKPEIFIENKTKENLTLQITYFNKLIFNLSMSDDYPIAQAVVVTSRE